MVKCKHKSAIRHLTENFV